MKLDMKQDLNVFYQVCVFLANWKNKMATLSLIGWGFLVHLSRRLKCTIVITRCPSSVRRPSSVVNFSHFRLRLWNHWTEFNETWQEAGSQRPLPSLCFSGRSEKQDGRPGLWLAETFSTSPLKPLNGIQWNLTGSKISTSSTKFVFFGPIGKTIWPPWPLICWDIYDFSETAEQNSTKLDRKQDLNVLYQVCVFWADRKNKMAALASDWLRLFPLLLWNRWTEFNETWQEARSQRPLPSLCFSGRSEKKRWPPWPLIGWDIFDFFSETAEQNSTKHDRKQDLNVLYQVCVFRADRKNKMAALASDLAETFSTSPLKPLYRIQWNLAGSKISTSSTKFVYFGPIGKTRWPPWPLICWDIFNFSSETAEWNSMKLGRKQDLNVLFQVCVFRATRKNKIAALASDWLRHFQLLLWNRWMEFNETWQEARSQRPLPSLCFLGPIGKTRWRPWPLIGWDFFHFSSETAEQNSTKLDRKQDLNVLFQVCVFWGRSEKQDGGPGLWLAETFSTSPLKPLNRIQRNLAGSKISTSSTKFVFFGSIGKKKMAALASDWLRHFRLLLWNRWTEFNQTWQEARSQRPLPSLCFSGRSEKQDGRPGLWFAETFSTSPLKPLYRIQWNLAESKISTSSTKFVYFGPIGKTRWPPWPLICWDIFNFSSETAEWNSMKLGRKQDLNVLFQACVFRATRKNKIAALASDWLRHFQLLLWNRWMEFNETWQEARSQRPLPSLCFLGPIGKTRWPPWPLIG